MKAAGRCPSYRGPGALNPEHCKQRGASVQCYLLQESHLVDGWQVAICQGHSAAHSLEGLRAEAGNSPRGDCGDHVLNIVCVGSPVIAKAAAVGVGVQHMFDASALQQSRERP